MLVFTLNQIRVPASPSSTAVYMRAGQAVLVMAGVEENERGYRVVGASWTRHKARPQRQAWKVSGLFCRVHVGLVRMIQLLYLKQTVRNKSVLEGGFHLPFNPITPELWLLC